MAYTISGGIEWEKDETTKTLKIRPSATPEHGTPGWMDDYDVAGVGPWGLITEEGWTLDMSETIIYEGKIKTVYEIGKCAFKGCTGITTVNFSDDIGYIYDSAFEGCSGLRGTLFFNDASNFYANAFKGCSGIDGMKFKCGDPEIGEGAFEFNTSLPAKTYEITAPGWAMEEFVPQSEFTKFDYKFEAAVSGGLEWFGEYAEPGPDPEDPYKNYLVLRPTATPEEGYAIGQMKDYENEDGSSPRPWVGLGTVGSIRLEEGTTNIGNNFMSEAMVVKSFNIPSTVTKIGDGAFLMCMSWAGELTLPAGVTEIGDYAFGACVSLTNIVLPEGLEKIGYRALAACTGFTGTYTVPSTVTEIGEDAFMGTKNIDGIEFLCDEPTLGANAFVFNNEEPAKTYKITSNGWADETKIPPTEFTTYEFEVIEDFEKSGGVEWKADETNKKIIIRPTENPESGYTKGQMKDYELAGPWKDYIKAGWTVELDDGITSIGDKAFSGCTTLGGTLEIPDTVTSIGSSAFNGCTSLTGMLVIPESVTEVGSTAFVFCDHISGIKFEGDKPTIGDGAFYIHPSPPAKTYDVYSKDNWADETTFPPMEYTKWEYKIDYQKDGGIEWYKDPETKKIITRPTDDPEEGYTAGHMKDYLPGEAPWGEITEDGWTVEIAEGMENVGDNAFTGSSGITEITLPDGITSIGDNAFNGCTNITGTLTIPDTVTDIGANAFYNCPNISELEFLGDKPEIGDNAFVFNTTTPAKTYTVTTNGWADETTFPPSEYTKWDYEMTPQTSGGIEWYRDPETKKIVIGPAENPEEGYTAGQMKSYSSGDAPWGKITENGWSVEIDEGIINVSMGAFQNCTGITDISFPEGLQYIDGWSFQGCSGLTGTLVIPASVTEISSGAFVGCSNLDGIEFLGDEPSMLIDSFILNTTAPAKTYVVTSNGWANETTFPPTAYTKWEYRQEWNLDGGIEWKRDNTTKELLFRPAENPEEGYTSGQMKDHSDTRPWGKIETETGWSLTLYDGITHIGANAFAGCIGLQCEMDIPKTVTSIGGSAFNNCTGLTGTIELSKDFTSVGNMAFIGCDNVSGVIFKGDQPTLGNYAFCLKVQTPSKTYSVLSKGGWANETTFPKYTFTDWNYDSLWNLDGGIEWMKDETTKELKVRPAEEPEEGYVSGQMKSYNMNGPWGAITETGWSLDLQDGILNIGEHAFSDCSGFVGELSIPSSVTKIDHNAFSDCNGFTGELNIPDTVTELGMGAFRTCFGFTSLHIPSGISEIKNGTFLLCYGLTGTLTLPDNVKALGTQAFGGCYGFTGLDLNKVETLNQNVFDSCYGFTGTLTIPATVTSISHGSFEGCKNVSCVEFLGSRPNLGEGVFALNNTEPVKTYDVKTDGWANESTFPSFTYTKWNYKKLGCNTYIKIDDVWREATVYVNVDGVWKEAGGTTYYNYWGEWKS